MLVLRARHLPPTERAMQGPDALGLGLFAASGTADRARSVVPSIVAVLMGTVTAAFGGVLRDVVCNEIPRVSTITGRTPSARSPAADWASSWGT